MLRLFLYKISSKLQKLETKFEDKTSFIMKISKSELIDSALEDENSGTEEIQMMNTCVALKSYNGTWTSPVKKSSWKKTASSIICSQLANVLSSSSSSKKKKIHSRNAFIFSYISRNKTFWP